MAKGGRREGTASSGGGGLEEGPPSAEPPPGLRLWGTAAPPTWSRRTSNRVRYRSIDPTSAAIFGGGEIGEGGGTLPPAPGPAPAPPPARTRPAPRRSRRGGQRAARSRGHSCCRRPAALRSFVSAALGGPPRGEVSRLFAGFGGKKINKERNKQIKMLQGLGWASGSYCSKASTKPPRQYLLLLSHPCWGLQVGG